MRIFLLFACVLLCCFGTVAADYECSYDNCNWCTGNNGFVRILLHNSEGFMQSSPHVTINGEYPASFTQIIYDNSENEFAGQVPPGPHTLKITATGYKEITGTIKVCSWQVTKIDLSPVRTASLGKTGINAAAANILTTTTTPSGSSGSSVKPGGAFGNVPLPTTTVPVAGSTTVAQAVAPANPGSAASTQQPDTLGSLSVKTEPAGAFIFIDGVQRGVAPATIPGIPAGTHTLLLKLDGYQDISTPVTIAAGKTQEYSSAMAKAAAPAEATAAATAAAEATVTPKKAPGFAFIAALAGLGAVLCMRKMQ